ncbi:hypothetical protein FLACOL_00249 [Flavobacterium columnare]|uniref:PAP2 superfamily protein n=3 Tax=Flavobacterium TaxID=237 RepID=A0A2N9P7G0_9FLAO|nr:hypothetical protein FLACOL_00249 [Flavobacterium columnare]
MKLFFSIFSYIFHPLFISFYTIVFYKFSNTEFFLCRYCIDYIYKAFIITILIPIAIFYFLIRFKKIEDAMIGNINERKIPLVLQLILYGIIMCFLVNTDEAPELLDYFLANSMSTFIAFCFIFLNKKISLHMLSIVSTSLWISFYCSKLNFISFFILIHVLFILTVSVGISRLIMKAHTPIELIQGSIIGAIPQLFLILYR